MKQFCGTAVVLPKIDTVVVTRSEGVMESFAHQSPIYWRFSEILVTSPLIQSFLPSQCWLNWQIQAHGVIPQIHQVLPFCYSTAMCWLSNFASALGLGWSPLAKCLLSDCRNPEIDFEVSHVLHYVLSRAVSRVILSSHNGQSGQISHYLNKAAAE